MSNISTLNGSAALEAGKRAARHIPPLWPLTSSVAVNPFLGQSGESLERTAARLERVAGVRVVMPRRWFGERILAGEITDTDSRPPRRTLLRTSASTRQRCAA